MPGLKDIEIDISTRLFLEVFTKYSTRSMYTHHLLISMIVKKEKDRQACIKSIKKHTTVGLSTVWDELVQRNPALKNSPNLSTLKPIILEQMLFINTPFNCKAEIGALLKMGTDHIEFANSISQYLASIIKLAKKFNLDRDSDGKVTEQRQYLQKGFKAHLEKLMWKSGSQDAQQEEKKILRLKAQTTPILSSMGGLLMMMVYALYQLMTDTQSKIFNFGLLALPLTLVIATTTRLYAQAKDELAVEIIYKHLSPGLKNNIKRAISDVIQNIIADQRKAKKLLSSRIPISDASSTNTPHVGVTASVHTLQSLYKGTSSGTKKTGKKNRDAANTQPENSAASSSVPVKALTISQWDLDGKGMIALPENADIYPLDVPGQYIFYNSQVIDDNEQADTIKRMMQDGKTVPAGSKGMPGIKVHSNEVITEGKVTSAVVKASNQRVYCRAVEAILSSGDKCILHVPEIAARKNQYKAYIRKR